MKIEEAQVVAQEVVAALEPIAIRIAVAGSIRRKKPEVHDIEIVMIPKHGHVRFIKHLSILGSGPRDKIGRKAPFGERYCKMAHRGTGVQVDIFSVLPPAQWGVIFLLRTGSADFSYGFVTRLYRKGLRCRGGHIERVSGEILLTPEEEDAFRVAGEPWIPPERR